MAFVQTAAQIEPAATRPLPRNVVLRAWALHRQRAALADLDAAALSDLGLSASEARTEAARPVWDAPGYWKA